MNDDSFALYGEIAGKLPPIMASGRHLFHEELEGEIVADVLDKLALEPGHRLLEIGCGMGLLLRPMAQRVREAVGMDHQLVVDELVARGLPENVRVIGGRFPDVRPDGTFDRIVVYSAVHYSASAQVAEDFVMACAALLSPAGVALIGDLPNADAKRRYLQTQEGQAISREYEELSKKAQAQAPQAYEQWWRLTFEKYIDDAFVLGLLGRLRAGGYESYVYPQRRSLPFSMTREDIVICRRGL